MVAAFATGPWDIRVTRDEALDRAQQLIGYKFKDASHLSTALTHASVANTRAESNERLEFLGDSLLSFVICYDLFRSHPEFLEGELTKVKSVVVSRKVCAVIADDMGLPALLFLGKGMNGRTGVPLSLRAAVFEAVIGAIFLDGGYPAARDFILRQACAHIEQAAQSENHDNYKSMLQQFAQKHLASTPVYEQVDERGPDHSKNFEVCVYINGRRFPAAWGASKKDAEQQAAMFALQELEPSTTEPEAESLSDDDA